MNLYCKDSTWFEFDFDTFPDRDYETYLETYPDGGYGACQCGWGQAGGEDEP